MKIPGTLVAALFFALLVTGGTPLHLSATSSPEPPANKLDDATIFAIFDEVNAADIWTARLGVKNAHSPEVRDLARAVVADHEQVQQMMRDLARKLSITPLPPDGDSSAQDHAKPSLCCKASPVPTSIVPTCSTKLNFTAQPSTP